MPVVYVHEFIWNESEQWDKIRCKHPRIRDGAALQFTSKYNSKLFHGYKRITNVYFTFMGIFIAYVFLYSTCFLLLFLFEEWNIWSHCRLFRFHGFSFEKTFMNQMTLESKGVQCRIYFALKIDLVWLYKVTFISFKLKFRNFFQE
jgi:hypothetical protein